MKSHIAFFVVAILILSGSLAFEDKVCVRLQDAEQVEQGTRYTYYVDPAILNSPDQFLLELSVDSGNIYSSNNQALFLADNKTRTSWLFGSAGLPVKNTALIFTTSGNSDPELSYIESYENGEYIRIPVNNGVCLS